MNELLTVEKYNVYVIGMDDFKAKRLIGGNLSSAKCELRERTGGALVDGQKYFVASYLVGSERDLELANDLK